MLATPNLAHRPDATRPTTPASKMSIRHLDFYYGGFRALKDVSLDIADHCVTAFIGPSGCGKSTLLRALNRMYSLYPNQRAEGEICFNGENILDARTDLNLLRAKVGMVFQKPTPFPMSIYDNIAFGVRLYERLSPRRMDERVEWALTKAAMWDEAKDKLRQSGIRFRTSVWCSLGVYRTCHSREKQQQRKDDRFHVVRVIPPDYYELLRTLRSHLQHGNLCQYSFGILLN